MLKYALYAPQVTLHLMSVGKLGDEGCRITLDATHCQVLRNNNVLAEGIREGKHLYHLQCDTLHFEHAAIAHAIPNLETWHQCLSHVNYTSCLSIFHPWKTDKETST